MRCLLFVCMSGTKHDEKQHDQKNTKEREHSSIDELLCVKDNDFCFGIHKNNPPCFLSFYEAYPENIPVFCVTKAGESCKIGNAV
ncbi:hypothetical protein RUMGNA_01685 [Mediterraneibacter gnavus ATCC 29149]|uniref:Uncharacterized protein n=1 Tax=Mediterraneibacter gnavus (strain ATCC 29149 / DSM 114966 / JCM 6515 / VPI C7-9) TaxID=411470 RepID=A7B2A8_MEDG7|nr:hypothetical protein RUMGNA_01685 [Mediterraneibacter gnavus ATCC 29149]